MACRPRNQPIPVPPGDKVQALHLLLPGQVKVSERIAQGADRRQRRKGIVEDQAAQAQGTVITSVTDTVANSS